MKFSHLAIAAVVAAGLAAPAAAVTTTYAQFGQQSSAKLVRYSAVRNAQNAVIGNRLQTTLSGGTTTAGIPVDFKYLVGNRLGNGFLNAKLTFDATTTQELVAGTGSSLSQGGYSGAITILRDPTAPVKNNLLTVTFSSGTFFTDLNGGSASFQATLNTPTGATLAQTSDWLDFGNVLDANFSLAFSGLNPAFPEPTKGFGRTTVRMNMSGTFASNPAPIGVPEPEMWGLMILGFGMVGVAARRRRAVSRVAA